MAMRIVSGNVNLTIANGSDCAGAVLLNSARKLVATGFWRFKDMGDGLSAVSFGTSDIFTANTNGWKTSGTFATAVANSFSNPLAHFRIEALDGSGTPTGPQVIVQRGSGSAAGNDRFMHVMFSLAGLTGTATATAPASTGSYDSMWEPGQGNSFGGAGANIFSNLAGTPYLGGGTATTVTYQVFLPTALSTGNIPALKVAWNTSASAGGAVFLESIVGSSSLTHPFIVGGDTQNRLFGATTLSGQPTSFNTAGQTIFTYDSGGTRRLVSFETVPMPDGTNRPANTTPVQAEAGGTYQIRKLWVDSDTTTSSTPLGYCETLEYLLPSGTAQMALATFHASVAAAEPARISWGFVTSRWVVGSPPTNTPGNLTNVRSTFPDPVAPEVDTTLPTLELVSPLDGQLRKTTPMVVDVDDESGIRLFIIYAYFQVPGRFAGNYAEVIYDGSFADMETLYTVTGPTEVGGKLRYSIVRKAGWPGLPVSLRGHVIDTSGNIDG